jgi:hypothetical protein
VVTLWPVIKPVLGRYIKALKDTTNRRSKWPGVIVGIVVALFGVGQLVSSNKVEALKDAEIGKLEKETKTTLSFHSKEITQKDNGYSVKVIFKPSNNKPLGVLYFEAKIINYSTGKILEFAPVSSGLTNASKEILDDGKTAHLTYSFVGIDLPEVELVLSSKAQVKISGSHELEPFEINIE